MPATVLLLHQLSSTSSSSSALRCSHSWRRLRQTRTQATGNTFLDLLRHHVFPMATCTLTETSPESSISASNSLISLLSHVFSPFHTDIQQKGRNFTSAWGRGLHVVWWRRSVALLSRTSSAAERVPFAETNPIKVRDAFPGVTPKHVACNPPK